MAVAASSPFNEKYKTTMVHAIVHTDLPPSEKTFERIFEEVATVTRAAFETTTNVLRLIFYHVYINKKVLACLREELATVPVDYSLKQLEQLPYLTAVITEGMRLSPAVASRAARITDKDLFYEGWRILAGTPVGMTTLLMHTDELLYPDPMRFDPDRWLASRTRASATTTYSPFSKGTRVCPGMQ